MVPISSLVIQTIFETQINTGSDACYSHSHCLWQLVILLLYFLKHILFYFVKCLLVYLFRGHGEGAHTGEGRGLTHWWVSSSSPGPIWVFEGLKWCSEGVFEGVFVFSHVGVWAVPPTDCATTSKWKIQQISGFCPYSHHFFSSAFQHYSTACCRDIQATFTWQCFYQKCEGIFFALSKVLCLHGDSVKIMHVHTDPWYKTLNTRKPFHVCPFPLSCKWALRLIQSWSYVDDRQRNLFYHWTYQWLYC